MNLKAPVILIGYRGAGKSTVGRLLADQVQAPFVDADLALEAHCGRAISTFFENGQETAFRELEAQLLATWLAGPPVVLATGGGCVAQKTSRDLLEKATQVFYLKAPADLLKRRIEGSNRPPLDPKGDEFLSVLPERLPWYQACANTVLDATCAPEALVREILEKLTP